MIKQIPLNEENCQQMVAIFAQPSSIYKSKLNPLANLRIASALFQEKSENIEVLIALLVGLKKK